MQPDVSAELLVESTKSHRIVYRSKPAYADLGPTGASAECLGCSDMKLNTPVAPRRLEIGQAVLLRSGEP
jgi:hypothetical protein